MSKKHFPLMTKTDMERRRKMTAAEGQIMSAISAAEKEHDLSILEVLAILHNLGKWFIGHALEWELEVREKATGEWETGKLPGE